MNYKQKTKQLKEYTELFEQELIKRGIKRGTHIPMHFWDWDWSKVDIINVFKNCKSLVTPTHNNHDQI